MQAAQIRKANAKDRLDGEGKVAGGAHAAATHLAGARAQDCACCLFSLRLLEG